MKAIMRLKKHNNRSTIANSANHTTRDNPPDNANLSIKNKYLVGDKDIMERLNKRLSECKSRSSRNVLAIEYLLTASPEFFEQNKGNKKVLSDFCTKSLEFLNKTHGKKNVVSAVLHIDEKTPHIVAYVVPEKDGQLNCKHFTGGKKKMSELQDGFAATVAPLGLERGIRGSTAKHTEIAKFYTKMKEAVKNLDFQELSFDELRDEINKKPFRKKGLLESSDSFEKYLKEEITKRAKAILDKHNEKVEAVKFIATENTDLHEKIKNQQLVIDFYEKAFADLNLDKEAVSQIRKTDTKAVAEKIGYKGKIGKANAIDLLMTAEKFSYKQAVAYLYENFHKKAAEKLVGDFSVRMIQNFPAPELQSEIAERKEKERKKKEREAAEQEAKERKQREEEQKRSKPMRPGTGASPGAKAQEWTEDEEPAYRPRF